MVDSEEAPSEGAVHSEDSEEALSVEVHSEDSVVEEDSVEVVHSVACLDRLNPHLEITSRS